VREARPSLDENGPVLDSRASERGDGVHLAQRILKRAVRPFNDVLRRRYIENFRWQPFGEYHNRVPTSDRVVSLTFDDGPLPPYTDQLLEVLAHHRVRATFFFVGENIERHRAAAARALAAGHQLGNHSYSHPRLYHRWPRFVRAQIESTDALLRELGVTGDIPFRAPYGVGFLVLPWILLRTKRRHVLFDFFPDPPDWRGGPPEAVAASVKAQTRPGSIIVLHDGNPTAGPHVAEIADLVITDLREQGYRFATVSELLALRS
jgi:peptidoglycan/xylan/chitin deacetylase (PgdA/CDA1 family)